MGVSQTCSEWTDGWMGGWTDEWLDEWNRQTAKTDGINYELRALSLPCLKTVIFALNHCLNQQTTVCWISITLDYSFCVLHGPSFGEPCLTHSK